MGIFVSEPTQYVLGFFRVNAYKTGSYKSVSVFPQF